MRTLLLSTIFLFLPLALFSQTPVLIDDELSIRSIASSPHESVRLSHNHDDGALYLLTRYGQIFRVNVESGGLSELQNSSDHQLEDVQGMDISSDGVFYIVGNIRDDANFTNTAVIKRGERSGDQWEWTTVAESEPYPLSNTFLIT